MQLTRSTPRTRSGSNATHANYPKALAKLDRDWMPLTALFDYPAEHWRHLRTTNPLIASADAVEKIAGSDLQWALQA